MSSHSPGPEPTTRTPSAPLAARPNGMPSIIAARPGAGARTWNLASGVQSVRVSTALDRRALISQPSLIVIGSGGVIGLRAIGTFSDTHPTSVRIDVRMLLHNAGLDQAPAWEADGNDGAGLGQPRLKLSQAYRPIQRRGQPAGGDPADDLACFDDLDGLVRNDCGIERLEADQPEAASVGVLPGKLGFPGEVLLVQPDGPVESRAERPGQAVGVLANDEVAFLEPQYPLCLDPERSNAQVGALLKQGFPDVQAVARWDVEFVAELAREADPPEHAVVHAGDLADPHVHVAEGVIGQVDALGDPLHQLPGLRTGHIDAGVGGGDRGDVHLPVGMAGLQPVLHPLPHHRGADDVVLIRYWSVPSRPVTPSSST